jgi:hypothetical protein
MIAPIQSLAQLRAKANKDPKYRSLAILAANNLGGDVGDSLDRAMNWLYTNAQEGEGEDDVIDEVNFLRSEV